MSMADSITRLQVSPPVERPSRAPVDSVKEYAIFMLDVRGRVVSWNKGAERVFGYRPSEIIGQTFARLFAPDQVLCGAPAEELRKAAQNQVERQQWHVRKDGTRFWADGITSVLRDDQGHVQRFVKVLRDITSGRRLKEELRRQAEEFAEANRRKSEFLALVRHELRDVLKCMLHALHVARQARADNPALQPVSGVIGQTERLIRLVDDVLDLSRISTREVALHKEPVDLNAVLHRAAEGVQPLMEECQQSLCVSVAREPVWLMADPGRLEQILVTLLRMIAKCGKPGTDIALMIQPEEENQVAVRVRNAGVDVLAPTLSRAFDVSTPADQLLGRTEWDFDIGLALAKSLVHLHGGSVEVVRDGPEEGAAFTVRLLLPSESYMDEPALVRHGEALAGSEEDGSRSPSLTTAW
jgi:PAS domain S-box-containing protein